MTDARRHRQAGPPDLEILLSLLQAYYRHDGLRYVEDELRPSLARLLSHPSLGRAYLLELAGQVAGYALLTFGYDLELGGDLGLLTDLYVEPGWRRKGHGLATLRFLEQLCRTLGIRALVLEVERHNVEAQAIYRAFGFRALDRIPLVKSIDR